MDSCQFFEMPNKIQQAYTASNVKSIHASDHGPGAVFTVTLKNGRKDRWVYVPVFQGGKGWTKVRNG
jgi:hypothetical protein